jgi:hypothetical protein
MPVQSPTRTPPISPTSYFEALKTKPNKRKVAKRAPKMDAPPTRTPPISPTSYFEALKTKPNKRNVAKRAPKMDAPPTRTPPISPTSYFKALKTKPNKRKAAKPPSPPVFTPHMPFLPLHVTRTPSPPAHQATSMQYRMKIISQKMKEIEALAKDINKPGIHVHYSSSTPKSTENINYVNISKKYSSDKVRRLQALIRRKIINKVKFLDGPRKGHIVLK